MLAVWFFFCGVGGPKTAQARERKTGGSTARRSTDERARDGARGGGSGDVIVVIVFNARLKITCGGKRENTTKRENHSLSVN